MAKTISILGCGWLGFPLARHLSEAGYTVKGSTTTADKLPILAANQILPYLIRLPEAPDPDFLEADVWVITIPPGSRDPGYQDRYPAQMHQLRTLAEQHQPQKVIMISSTSVYPDTKTDVFEENVTNEENAGNVVIFRAEEALRNIAGIQTVILRCGGLMGPGRVPGRYFAGRQNLTTGDIPVNFVHQQDVIQIISQMIGDKPIPYDTFNVVAPLHPTRREIYAVNAQSFGFAPPTFVTPERIPPYKVVRADRLVQDYSYNFKFPDPLLFKYD
ncbi:MAG: SDR family oxidoreductase [Bernardetiaceae bacterium]